MKSLNKKLCLSLIGIASFGGAVAPSAHADVSDPNFYSSMSDQDLVQNALAGKVGHCAVYGSADNYSLYVSDVDLNDNLSTAQAASSVREQLGLGNCDPVAPSTTDGNGFYISMSDSLLVNEALLSKLGGCTAVRHSADSYDVVVNANNLFTTVTAQQAASSLRQQITFGNCGQLPSHSAPVNPNPINPGQPPVNPNPIRPGQPPIPPRPIDDGRSYYLRMDNSSLAREGTFGSLGRCFATYGGGADTWSVYISGRLFESGIDYNETANDLRQYLMQGHCDPLTPPGTLNSHSYYLRMPNSELVQQGYLAKLGGCFVSYGDGSDTYAVYVNNRMESSGLSSDDAALYLRSQIGFGRCDMIPDPTSYNARSYFLSLNESELVRQGTQDRLGRCFVSYGGGADTYAVYENNGLLESSDNYQQAAIRLRTEIGLGYCGLDNPGNNQK